MRLRATLHTQKEIVLPGNYQEDLAATVRSFVQTSSVDFTNSLKQTATDDHSYFDMYAFSNLRGKSRMEGDKVVLSAGPHTWLFASPVNQFTEQFGVWLNSKSFLHFESKSIPITAIVPVDPPSFPAGRSSVPSAMACVSPMIAAVVDGSGSRRWLLPTDGDLFSESVREGLLGKYRRMYGRDPENTQFQLKFDSAYLARGAGSKTIAYQGEQLNAAFLPFTVAGSSDLITMGYEAGFGERNEDGFGMADLVVKKPLRR